MPFLFFKSRPIVPGRMGRAASRTMQAPFSQDVRWSSQGRKNAYDGASSACCLPLPSRLSHQPCLSDYHSPLVQIHFAQLKYCASCTALRKKTTTINTQSCRAPSMSPTLHSTQCWMKTPPCQECRPHLIDDSGLHPHRQFCGHRCSK